MKMLLHIIKVTVVLICMFSSFLVGYSVGVDNQIESVKGVYNIDMYDDGKVIITTKSNYLEGNNNDDKLIINGYATHEKIK